MAVKMNLRIITKNYAADPEKGFLAKSISKSNGYATAMPTAWELIKNFWRFSYLRTIKFSLIAKNGSDSEADAESMMSFCLNLDFRFVALWEISCIANGVIFSFSASISWTGPIRANRFAIFRSRKFVWATLNLYIKSSFPQIFSKISSGRLSMFFSDISKQSLFVLIWIQQPTYIWNTDQSGVFSIT